MFWYLVFALIYCFITAYAENEEFLINNLCSTCSFRVLSSFNFIWLKYQYELLAYDALKNGAIGEDNLDTTIKHSYKVWYAEILFLSYFPFQKRLLQRRTYQLLNLSTTKTWINLPDRVGS